MYKYTILFICLLTAPLISANERVIYKASYKTHYNGIKIKMHRQLVDKGNGHFLLHAYAKNFLGSIRESETFLWQEGKITPLNYYYKQSALGVKRVRSITYDWKNKQAFSVYKGNRFSFLLEEGDLGPMTYQLQLRIDLFANAEDLSYSFINKNRKRNYVFNIVNDGALIRQSNGILHLRRADEGKDKSTDLWFDTAQAFVLRRLVQSDEGKKRAMELVHHESFPPFEKTPYKALHQAAKQDTNAET